MRLRNCTRRAVTLGHKKNKRRASNSAGGGASLVAHEVVDANCSEFRLTNTVAVKLLFAMARSVLGEERGLVCENMCWNFLFIIK